MKTKIKNEELVKDSNQPQKENLSQRSKEIIEMTIQKKEEIQSLYKDGFMSRGESNSLVRRCNDILNQTNDESILQIGRKHGGLLCINYDMLYRDPKEMEYLIKMLNGQLNNNK